MRETLLNKLDRNLDVKELMRDLVFSVEGLLRPSALKPAEGGDSRVRFRSLRYSPLKSLPWQEVACL